MKSPLVSVIVPCYKQAEWLPETLDSVIAQSYQNWECIIVDDGSPDNTKDVASDYCLKDSRIKYYHQVNSGPSVARNTGIKNTEGEYILPLDADDIIGERYLEKSINYFEQNPSCKLVYCKARMFGKENREWVLCDYSYDTMRWQNCIFCSAIFKRSDYLKTQGYNENMKYGWEDWDFWLSLLDRDDEVHRLDEVMFFYRVKEFSRTSMANDNTKHLFKLLFQNHLDLYKDIEGRELELFSEMMYFKQELQVIKSSKLYCTYKKITRFFIRTFHLSFKRKL